MKNFVFAFSPWMHMGWVFKKKVAATDFFSCSHISFSLSFTLASLFPDKSISQSHTQPSLNHVYRQITTSWAACNFLVWKSGPLSSGGVLIRLSSTELLLLRSTGTSGDPSPPFFPTCQMNSGQNLNTHSGAVSPSMDIEGTAATPVFHRLQENRLKVVELSCVVLSK